MFMETRKWKKRRLLVDFGIQSKKQLESTMSRYSIFDKEKCLTYAETQLNNSKDDIMNFIILVSQKETQGLPSFKINNANDLNVIADKLATFDLTRYTEIWNVHDKKQEAIWGRQSLYLDDPLFHRIVPSVLELNNGVSCREFEKYPDISNGYLQLKRANTNQRFKIVNSLFKTEKGRNLVLNVDEVNSALISYQKRLVDFARFVKGAGISNISYDFNYTKENKISFFDWDTNNDSKLLGRLESLGI